MWDSLFSLATLSALLLSTFGLGRPLLRWLCPAVREPLAVGVWSLGLGLILFGTLWGWLAAAGCLTRPLLAAGTLGAAFWALGELAESVRRRAEAGNSWLPPTGDGSPPWERAAQAAVVGTILLGTLLSALAPPTAGDALCYHLELAKQFAQSGALVGPIDNDNATYPLLAEMWYAWALALDGPVAAQLVHWAAGVLAAAATVLLARPILGPRAARWSGCFLLAAPGLNNQMTAPLNDGALVLCSALALAAVRPALSNQRDGNRWDLLAGVALGGALAVKYTAILLTLALCCCTVYSFWRIADRRRQLLCEVCCAALVATSVAGVWYARSTYYRGNPVYPFFEDLRGSSEARSTLPETKSRWGRSPAALLVAPWRLTMHPEECGGRGHQVGPLWLALLPGLMLAPRKRELTWLFFAGGSYFVVWFLLRQNSRFLLPCLPIGAVLAAAAWPARETWPIWPRRLYLATQAGLLLALMLVPLRRVRDQWPVALGIESRAAYLSRTEPTWELGEVLNTLGGPQAKVLSQEQRAFYLTGHITRENLYRRRTHYDARMQAPADLARQLQADGFTHLLLAENLSPKGIRFNRRLATLVDEATAQDSDNHFAPLFEHRFTTAAGEELRYRLYRLR